MLFDIQNPVKVYKIIYESIGVDGKPTELSGAVYVPQLEEKRALPTLKISHYTITERDAVASVRPMFHPRVYLVLCKVILLFMPMVLDLVYQKHRRLL